MAKRPHALFLSNLVANHVLLFASIATLGPSYLHLIGFIPVISVAVIGYTLFHAAMLQRQDSEFVFTYWQVAVRWSKSLAIMLILLGLASSIAWYAQAKLGLMREMSYALAGGLGLMPMLVLVVIESDSLHHAKEGTYPKWARRRFLDELT